MVEFVALVIAWLSSAPLGLRPGLWATFTLAGPVLGLSGGWALARLLALSPTAFVLVGGTTRGVADWYAVGVDLTRGVPAVMVVDRATGVPFAWWREEY